MQIESCDQAMGHGAYMDHNATTPLRPQAAAALVAMAAFVGNPSSVHRFGRTVRRKIDDAREAVAGLVGCEPSQVVFTSGATEANGLALRALSSDGAGRRILVSAVEHDSVLAWADDGSIIPVTAEGIVDLARLEALLAGEARPAIVSLMAANNETGVLQPVAAVAELAHRYGALVHCDAAQAAGKIPISVTDLAVDLMSLSAHKLGGPAGVGALIVGDGVTLAPIMRGGGQERRRRAGTENVIGAVSFGAAAAAALEDLDRFAALESLRDGLEQRARVVSPGTEIFGRHAPRLANTSCLTMPGVPSETQVVALDLAGVAVGAGAACSSGKVRSSHVLEAMGVGASVAATAIRVSLGWTSAQADVDRFVGAWLALWRRVGNREDRLAAG